MDLCFQMANQVDPSVEFCYQRHWSPHAQENENQRHWSPHALQLQANETHNRKTTHINTFNPECGTAKSLAISGERVAWSWHQSQPHVYEFDGRGWTDTGFHYERGYNSTDGFWQQEMSETGSILALNGDYLLVGDGNSYQQTGSVSLHRIHPDQDNSWEQVPVICCVPQDVLESLLQVDMLKGDKDYQQFGWNVQSSGNLFAAQSLTEVRVYMIVHDKLEQVRKRLS